MNNTFNELQNLYNEYLKIKSQIKSSNEAAKEMMKAINERLETERERNEQHINELTNKLSSSAFSDTVKHITKLELNKYQSFKYFVTTEESEAVKNEINTLDVAIKDARTLREKIREAINSAKRELETIREETIGDKSSISYENWIESLQKEYSVLLKRWEVDAND